MSEYTRVEYAVLDTGIRYKTLVPLVWHIGHEYGPEYEVPVGYTFDVSIPWPVRWIFDPHRQEYHKAAALHDHMLESDWSRITAAAEFHNALRADGVGVIPRFVMLLAVIIWKFN